MDAIISFLCGIVIFLFGFIWTKIEKKRRRRIKQKIEEKSELIDNKNKDIERDENGKAILGNITDLKKGNYLRKEEMSDQDRKFLEKYDKKIDKKHERIINDLTKRQNKKIDQIKDAEVEIEILEDMIRHPAKMTEYLGIVISLLSLILQLIQK